ncbi:cytochrome c biogenesis CcdA family protein [Chloroflexota bacterium]
MNVSLIIAFSAGLLSFLSPCVLPLVPIYVASLYGADIFDDKVSKFRMPLFLHSLAFVIGLSLVFSLWGASVGAVGSALVAHVSVIREIAGSLLIIFGLFMLAALKVPWLNYESRLNSPVGNTIGYLRSFLTGAIFSLAWTPCVTPILGGILALALNTATAWHGAYLLGIYSLGLGLPFLIIGAAFDSITPLLRRISSHSTTIHFFSAVLLIAVGILIVTNRLTWVFSVI